MDRELLGTDAGKDYHLERIIFFFALSINQALPRKADMKMSAFFLVTDWQRCRSTWGLGPGSAPGTTEWGVRR
jgi:hypothetical protein